MVWVDKHVLILVLFFSKFWPSMRVNAMLLHVIAYSIMVMGARWPNGLAAVIVVASCGSLLILIILLLVSVLLRHHTSWMHGRHTWPHVVNWCYFMTIHDCLRLLQSWLLMVSSSCRRWYGRMMLNYGVIVSRLGRSRRDRLLLQLLLHHLLLLMYGALLSDLLNHISDLIRLIRDKRLLVRWNEAIRHCRALTATTAKRLHPEDPLPR